jgi:carboxylesterase
MNINDFCTMRRGSPVDILSFHEVEKLQPVIWRNGQRKNALLLLHGFGSTPAVFREMLPALTGYDAIMVPALPGHADSLDAFAAITVDKLLAYGDEVCACLVQEYDQVDVLGLSLGGLIATHLANRFKLHHLYLLAPAFDLHMALNRMLTLARWLNKLGFRYLRSAAGDIHTAKHTEIAYRQLPLSAIIEVLTLIKSFSFKNPSCPTDLFLGSHDSVVSSQQVAARFIDQDNVLIHWLTNSAHVLPLDNDINIIVKCIQDNNR